MNAGMGWADLELLDHIVRAGTLSGAASTLDVDQTTVSRRLAALERTLQSTLFDRVAGRLAPTPVLAAVLDRLRAMSEEASLSLALLKRAGAELRGHVRVTSTGFVLARILAPGLAAFDRDQPGVTLDFVADDQSLSFERREADIAVRFGRRAEETTLIRSLGSIGFRLYRPAGTPPGPVPVVRYAEELAHLPEMAALDRCRPAARVALRANRLDVLEQAALALGAEIMLPEPLAEGDARFECVAEPEARAERPLFLLTHPERARIPTVTLVADWIETTVRRWRRA